MKNIVITLLLLLGMCSASAQLIKEKEPVDPKYLAGAVPVVDGKVTFSRDVPVPVPMSQDSLFRYVHRWANYFFSEQKALKYYDLGSDRKAFIHDLGVAQYLVFKNKALALDRARIFFRLNIKQEDGILHVSMTDISYLYEEDRDPFKVTAEEWITDEKSLNRKKTGFLHGGQGKFRMKTIDHFEEIISDLQLFLEMLAKPKE